MRLHSGLWMRLRNLQLMKDEELRMKNGIKRVEFVVTKACSSYCAHCSWGDALQGDGRAIDGVVAARKVAELAAEHSIESVMTFGGEPLLFPDVVVQIHDAAFRAGIVRRQLITNGYFSKDAKRIDAVAKMLCDAEVNDILISVDAFHQAHAPLEYVLAFGRSLLAFGATKVRAHPAWVVNEQHDNAYNSETKRLLAVFAEAGIAASGGNDIIMSGNAVKNLSEFADESLQVSPYAGDGGVVSFEPDSFIADGA